MQVIDLKWFSLIFSSDGVLTEPSYQNKLYNMTVLKTHDSVHRFKTELRYRAVSSFAINLPPMGWVLSVVLSKKSSTLFNTTPTLPRAKTPPSREARSCGSTGSQERKWKQEREREEQRSHSVFHFYPLLLPAPPPLSSSPLPTRMGLCQPRSARKTCRQQGVTKG